MSTTGIAFGKYFLHYVRGPRRDKLSRHYTVSGSTSKLIELSLTWACTCCCCRVESGTPDTCNPGLCDVATRRARCREK